MGIHWVDALIFIVYLIAMLGVGFFFLRKNESNEDYYVGGRSLSSWHVGLSVVATDVGGGFSIGLGGLGFMMGISGSWMLFTGLLGAWLSAVLLIPKVYPVAKKHALLTFPEALQHFYSGKVALVAGLVSFIGYIGFTSSQILAGAKLAAATFPTISINQAVLAMGVIAVVYTVMGGIKAVIYTDTIQWIILLSGLIFIGIPISYFKLGGWAVISEALPAEFFSLSNVKVVQLFNWLITILPIWFVGMTLYQRIYACKTEKDAIKAWRIAGLFEYPIMAFMGVLLGLFARIAFDQGMFTAVGYAPDQMIDAELGLPLLLSNILPVGLMGIMMAAYFSAIMSTADSCLMAASGNFMTDIIGSFKNVDGASAITTSRWITLAIGVAAIALATTMQNVLELMLYSYAFMVSGLFIPVLGMLFSTKPNASAALAAMVAGGGTTLFLIVTQYALPFDLDANFFGIIASALGYLSVAFFAKKTA